MRGNLPPSPAMTRAERSIPACAGEPGSRYQAQAIFKVYPRVCGGTPLLYLIDSVRQGLSPRVRGNQCTGESLDKALRSIPACAGEPAAAGDDVEIHWVYPRVCGGTSPAPDTWIPMLGLSPRVRGNPALRALAGV